MPTVPLIPGGAGATGSSPLASPKPSGVNMLMAMADLHQSGGLTSPKGDAALGLGTKSGKAHKQTRKLKVVK